MRILELPQSWRERALVLEWNDADLANAATFFAPRELVTAAAHRLEKRRTEWMLGRIAAKILASQLGLGRDPRLVVVERPHLEIDGVESSSFVSLSHSAPFAGAAIGSAPVGIDVQVVREISDSAAHLFLTDEETDEMQRCTLPHKLLHFWCAKEAAWKQRLGETMTLKRVPLRLDSETADGLRFDSVETLAVDSVVVALTLPAS